MTSSTLGHSYAGNLCDCQLFISISTISKALDPYLSNIARGLGISSYDIGISRSLYSGPHLLRSIYCHWLIRHINPNRLELTHVILGDAAIILEDVLSFSFEGYISFPVKLLSGQYHKTSLIISQCWFRQLLDVVRHQTITWTNVDHVLWLHMVSLRP